MPVYIGNIKSDTPKLLANFASSRSLSIKIDYAGSSVFEYIITRKGKHIASIRNARSFGKGRIGERWLVSVAPNWSKAYGAKNIADAVRYLDDMLSLSGRKTDRSPSARGMGRVKSGSLTQLSKLKKGEMFSKVGKDGRELDRLYIYQGKERRYNRWGDFLGWEFTFSAYDDISYFGRSVKDIDVIKL